MQCCGRVQGWGDAAGGRRLRIGGVPAGGAGRRPRAAPCALSTPSSEHACCTRSRKMSRARGRASDGWGRAFSVVRTRQPRFLRERKRHCHGGGQMQQKRMPGATRRHAGLKRVLDTCRAAAPPAGDAACAEAAPRGGEAAARTPGALPAKDRSTQRRLRLAGQRAPRMGAPQPRRQGRPDRPAEPTVRGEEQPAVHRTSAGKMSSGVGGFTGRHGQIVRIVLQGLWLAGWVGAASREARLGTAAAAAGRLAAAAGTLLARDSPRV